MKAILNTGDRLTQQDPVACGTRIAADGWVPTRALLLLGLEFGWRRGSGWGPEAGRTGSAVRMQSAEAPLEPASKAGERLGAQGCGESGKHTVPGGTDLTQRTLSQAAFTSLRQRTAAHLSSRSLNQIILLSWPDALRPSHHVIAGLTGHWRLGGRGRGEALAAVCPPVPGEVVS